MTASHTEEIKLPQYVYVNLGKVAAKDPDFIEKNKHLVEKPEPVVTDIVFLHPIRSLFCDHYSITIDDLKNQTFYRKKFIAVALALCNPEYVFNHRPTVKDGVAETISRLLDTKRDWISQQVNYIKNLLNPPAYAIKTYQEERRELNEVTELLFHQLCEAEGFSDPKEIGHVEDMFKMEAG